MENYCAADLLPKEKTVVLCMATYGDGEPTDNAAEFYKWLLKEAEAVDDGDKEPFLTVGQSCHHHECCDGIHPRISVRISYVQGVNYAVFGLGNKQYEHFNAVGKKIFKSLGAMGAAPLVRRGDGDDDGAFLGLECSVYEAPQMTACPNDLMACVLQNLASIDEDFEKWCVEFHEALEKRSDLAGAKADQKADESVNGVAAYEVQVWDVQVWT